MLSQAKINSLLADRIRRCDASHLFRFLPLLFPLLLPPSSSLSSFLLLLPPSLSAAGPVPSPFDCFLANRGLKTLHIRMREHQKNAMAVAQFLNSSPYVTEVMYPGGQREHHQYIKHEQLSTMDDGVTSCRHELAKHFHLLIPLEAERLSLGM